MKVHTVFSVVDGNDVAQEYEVEGAGQETVQAIKKEFPSNIRTKTFFRVILLGFKIDDVFVPVYLG